MIRTFETCPVCGGRGTRRQRDGIARGARTPPRDRCIACNGDGSIPRRRLRTLVLRGVRASEQAIEKGGA